MSKLVGVTADDLQALAADDLQALAAKAEELDKIAEALGCEPYATALAVADLIKAVRGG